MLTKSFSGWITRSSEGAVYFHTSKPYCVRTEQYDSRKDKPTTTKYWFCEEESYFLGLGEDYPVTDKKPIPATMEFYMKEI